MITGKDETKILTKVLLKKCHSVIQINDGITINVDVTVKNGYACEKDYIYFYSLLAFLLVSIALKTH